MDTYNFQTNNYYIKYNLYDHLNRINSSIFNTGYSFLIDTKLNYFDFEISYYDNEKHERLIKIKPFVSSTINYFRKNTFVKLNSTLGLGDNFKTFIIDLVPNDYMIIEPCKTNTGLTDTPYFDIYTIYNLKDISDILYDVYTNIDYDYYRTRDDDRRKAICNAYADFISEDNNIINQTTAILTQDQERKFILKIYDPENLYNGGVGRKPLVYTLPPTGITYKSAICRGEVTDNGGYNITDWGIRWGRTSSLSPYTQQSTYLSPNGQPGTFEVSLIGSSITGTCISGLEPNTDYYYQAYAKNKNGTSYGYIIGFTTTGATSSEPPQVYTEVAEYVTSGIRTLSHWLRLNGEVISCGYEPTGPVPVSEKGFEYEIGVVTSTPMANTIFNTGPNTGIGHYSNEVSGLTPSSGYSYVAFVIASGTSTRIYGNTGYTITPSPTPPNIYTYKWSFTHETIIVSGRTTFDDDELFTDIGVYLKKDAVPTISDYDQKIQGAIPPLLYTIGNEYIYSCTFTGLTSDSNYYVMAYCSNIYHQIVGESKYIKTRKTPTAPLLTINSIIEGIYDCSFTTTATDGNLDLTSRKIYYSTVNNPPLTSDYYVEQSPLVLSGGTWTTSLTGLTAFSDYYLLFETKNSYATSNTSSGFTTLHQPILPTITCANISYDYNSFEVQSIITDTGYSTITAKGIVYSLNPNPTLTSTNIPYVGTNSTWNTIVSSLNPETTYYVRSYSTNSAGTGYSNELIITTTSSPPVLYTPYVASNLTPISMNIVSSIFNTSSAILEVGIYSGTTSPPTSKVVHTGSITLPYIGYTWTQSLNGLTPVTQYYFKSYAIDQNGEGQSSIISQITPNYSIPTLSINQASDIIHSGATITGTLTSNGYHTITDIGVCFTGQTGDFDCVNGTLPITTGDPYTVYISPLLDNDYYTGKSYAVNTLGTGYSSDIYFKTLIQNNSNISLVVSGSSTLGDSIVKYDLHTYEMGGSYGDIISYENLSLNGDVTTSNLTNGWVSSGDTLISTEYTLFSWSTDGLLSHNSTIGQFTTYAPDSAVTSTYNEYYKVYQNFTGAVPTQVTGYTMIKAVYPYLTCAREPEYHHGDPIPSIDNIIEWCISGWTYRGYIPKNKYVFTGSGWTGDPMLRIMDDEAGNTGTRTFTIVFDTHYNKNLIYFCIPSEYGEVKTITTLIDGVTTILPESSYTNYSNIMTLSSKVAYGNSPEYKEWNVEYNIYMFLTYIDKTVQVTYTILK